MPHNERQIKNQKQAQMLANRVTKRYRHLYKRFDRQRIEVFRLYDWDIPEIRAVVDWYAGHLVIGEYTRMQSTADWLPLMGAAVAAALNVPASKLHLKQRFYGMPEGQRYQRLDHTDALFPVRERDLKFYVNPNDFVDTGLFADHRNTRQLVRKMAAGKHFLNLFCYTASFSCYAAQGGACSTVSVDRSQTAIAWARKNLALNNLDQSHNRLIQSHTLDFLTRAKQQSRRFDLAVVDPPSFYLRKLKNDQFDVNRDHPQLLEAVVALMKPGGTLFFSTNHQKFSPRLETLHITGADEITARTIPEDYEHKRKTIHRCWKMTI